MKIAIITDKIFPLYYGGYEILLYNVAKWLSSEMQVDVFTAEDDEKRVIA